MVERLLFLGLLVNGVQIFNCHVMLLEPLFHFACCLLIGTVKVKPELVVVIFVKVQLLVVHLPW